MSTKNKIFISLSSFLIICLITIFVYPFKAKAFMGKDSEQNIFVAKNELVPYNFVVAASGYIDFQGEAQKDVVVASDTVSINGPVHGDVIAAGKNIKINGRVDGNLRLIGGTVEINSKIGKNVTVMADSVIFGEGAEVGWDVMLGATDQVVIKGVVNGNVNIAAGRVVLGGKIKGKSVIYSLYKESQINLLPTADLAGDLEYWSNNQVALPEGAVITGQLNYHKLDKENIWDKMFKHEQDFSLAAILLMIVWKIFSILLVGIIVIKLFTKQTLAITDKMKQRPWVSMAWGLLWLLLVPIIAIASLVLMITWPLVMIIMALYFIIIYLAKIFVAVVLGQYLVKTLNQQKKPKEEIVTVTTTETTDKPAEQSPDLLKILILGVVFYSLLVNLSVLGLLIYILTLLWALGAIGKQISEWMKLVLNNK